MSGRNTKNPSKRTIPEAMSIDEFEESMGCEVASEASLKKIWDTPEEEEAWKYLEELSDK
jgi:hypothetical protein